VQFAADRERNNQLIMNHRLVVGRARATASKPPRLRFRNLVGVAVVLPVLAVPASAGATTLLGSGSSAAQPYMLALFSAYSKLHKNIVFKYIPDGGNAGVKDVQASRVQFAINTRPPQPSDSGTTYTKLFLDALCIDVNSKNGLSNISTTTLKNVFLGTDTNWSQVSGSGLSATIDPLGRNSTSGQYTFFQQSVLGGATQATNVDQLTSDGLVATAVTKDPDGIGYVGLAHSTETGEKPVQVNGVACNATHVKNESYPLFRYDWAVLPSSSPSIAVQQFFNWVRTSSAAGTVITKAGAVAAFNAAPPKPKAKKK
jgi:phosphate transport system substrate-binding protein